MDCSLPGSSVHEDSPGKNTGVGCHFLLQEIFPTQGLNPGLLHCRQTLYWLSYKGRSLYMYMCVYIYTRTYILFLFGHTIWLLGSSSPGESSQPRDWTLISHIAGRLFTNWATREDLAPQKESEVTQSCPTLCNPMDYSPPGSSVHGIFQARVPEWVAISFSRGSSWPRDRTRVYHIVGRRFTIWATREVYLKS